MNPQERELLQQLYNAGWLGVRLDLMDEGSVIELEFLKYAYRSSYQQRAYITKLGQITLRNTK